MTYNKLPPDVALRNRVLVMVLGRQMVAFRRRNHVTASGAPIDARIWGGVACGRDVIESVMVHLFQVRGIFVECRHCVKPLLWVGRNRLDASH